MTRQSSVPGCRIDRRCQTICCRDKGKGRNMSSRAFTYPHTLYRRQSDETLELHRQVGIASTGKNKSGFRFLDEVGMTTHTIAHDHRQAELHGFIDDETPRLPGATA